MSSGVFPSEFKTDYPDRLGAHLRLFVEVCRLIENANIDRFRETFSYIDPYGLAQPSKADDPKTARAQIEFVHRAE